MVKEMYWHACFVLVFVAAGFLGRATIVDDKALSLVWPAAGVAVVWFLHDRGPRSMAINLVLLSTATFVVNRSTGSSTAMAVVFVAANVAQVLTIVALLQAQVAPLRDPRRAPLDSLRELQRFLGAAGVGCLVGVAIGAAGLAAVTGFFSWDSTLTWWGRNVAGVLGVGVTGLLLLHQLEQRRDEPRAELLEEPAGPVSEALPGRVADTHPSSGDYPAPRSAGHGELAALIAGTAAIFVLDYSSATLPVSFLLPAFTVWAGLRFSPLVVALHALLGGAAFVWLTLEARGPFVGIGSLYRTALLAQVFVGMAFMLGLFLAASRRESQLLQANLADSQRAASAQANLLETIISSMTDSVIVVDHTRRITLANAAAQRAIGAPLSELRDRDTTVFALYRPEGGELPLDQRPSVRALRGETTPAVDVCLEPDRQRVYTASGGPLRDHHDRIVGAVVMFHDLTDERAHQRELGAFARVAAHDLTNPISVIQGWAEQLGSMIAHPTPVEPDRQTQLNVIDRITAACHQMDALVGDLLRDATARDRALSPGILDPAALIRDVVTSTDATGVTVGPIPHVWGDADLVRQVITNLLNNAQKYAAPDTLPHVKVTGTRSTDGFVHIQVRDHGIGIPAGMHESVFEDFVRAHPTHAPGTGLGLAICRRIVERHGGRISAHPPADGAAGTIFDFTLPPAPDTGPEMDSIKVQSARRLASDAGHHARSEAGLE